VTPRWRSATGTLALLVASSSACAPSTTTESDRAATTIPPSTTEAPPAAAESPSTTASTVPSIVEVTFRIEVRSTDPTVADFPAEVERILLDRRGWQRANFRLLRRDDAPYTVVLAEPDDAQQLCRPYDVYRTYSCQNGPLVVINADRWRTATPKWTGDLPTYREMLVNHEFGHLLGLHHPVEQCPKVGEPAPVMAQQSTELDGCLPNPWPLPHEIARAAQHDLPLAPPPVGR
jgi:hypothetical protein